MPKRSRRGEESMPGRVVELLDHAGQTVDLVHEEDVSLVQVGEDAHEVPAPFERWPGRGDNACRHLVGQDGGQRGLAEAGGTREQYMVEGLAALARRFHGHAEAFHRGTLPHVLVEVLGAKLALEACL